VAKSSEAGFCSSGESIAMWMRYKII